MWLDGAAMAMVRGRGDVESCRRVVFVGRAGRVLFEGHAL